MFKAVLCMIIIISSGTLGLIKSHSFSQRIHELNDLYIMIHQLNIEISFRKDPLTTTFLRVASQDINLSSKLLYKCTDYMSDFDEFTQCWTSAVNDTYSDSSLKKEDKKILSDLGTQLGKCNIQGQADILNLTEEKLMHQLKLAETEKNSKGKMFGGLGFSMGIIVSVLLI